MKKRLIQGFTLVSFLTLIVLFVAYKGGFIGRSSDYLHIDPNGTVIKNNQEDSVTILDTVIREEALMPSSKSMIISDQAKFKFDSTIYHKLIEEYHRKEGEENKKQKVYMYSSKSGYVIDRDRESLWKSNDSMLIEYLKRGATDSTDKKNN